jgi:hypothetical protein
LAAVLGGAELVVAMRLHSGILAATAGTPSVVVDYDPKTRAFAKQTGQLWWTVKVDALESASAGAFGAGSSSHAAASPPGIQDLFEAIVDTAGDLPARHAALARAVAPLRTEATRTAGLAVQLASEGGSAAGHGKWTRRRRPLDGT